MTELLLAAKLADTAHGRVLASFSSSLHWPRLSPTGFATPLKIGPSHIQKASGVIIDTPPLVVSVRGNHKQIHTLQWHPDWMDATAGFDTDEVSNSDWVHALYLLALML